MVYQNWNDTGLKYMCVNCKRVKNQIESLLRTKTVRILEHCAKFLGRLVKVFWGVTINMLVKNIGLNQLL